MCQRIHYLENLLADLVFMNINFINQLKAHIEELLIEDLLKNIKS